MDYQEKVASAIDYVLSGHNITETAKHFNCGRPYIISLLDEVRIKEGKFYNPELATKIENTLQELTAQVRKMAGQKGRPPLSLTKEEVINCIFDIIFKGESTRSLGASHNCSAVTISKSIKRTVSQDFISIIGDIRKIGAKNSRNPMFPYMVYEWLFSKETVDRLSDPEDIEILSIIYELAVSSYDFERRDCEEAWTR